MLENSVLVSSIPDISSNNFKLEDMLLKPNEIVRRQSFWYQSWFKLSESLAHLVNYTMLRACCDASVALRMSFV